MTDFVLSFNHYNEIMFSVGQCHWTGHRQTNQDFRPSWLRYLRIYELVPALRDQEALAVLADALEVGERGSVDAIIREYGVVGRWRPSTVLVRQLVNWGANRNVATDVPAHALWNTDLHDPCSPNNAYKLDLEIEHPAQGDAERRVFRAVMHFTEMTPEDLGQGTPTRDLETLVHNLERKYLLLEQKVTRIARATTPAAPDKKGG